MEKQLQKGFTLIELMIALVIAAILLGVGIPSFTQAMKNSRISANYNIVAQALYIARSEAVKGSDIITVCPRAPGDVNQCGSDWTDGLLVYVDNIPEVTGSTPVLGAEDEVLYSQSELKKGATLSAFAKINRTDSVASPSTVIRYEPTGETDWANGYFRVCDDDRGAEFSKVLNVVVTGDIRSGRPANATSTTPVDVFGDEITCP